MKTSKKRLFLIVLFSILGISASSFLIGRDKGLLSQDVQIDRFADGTSIITDRGHGYRFSTPPGWYPLIVPATSDQLDEFSNIAQQNNLPLDGDWAASLPADVMQLAIVDLDENHHEDDPGVLIAVLYTDMARFIPAGGVTPFIELLKLSGKVATSYLVEKSEQQEVGIVEIASLPDDNPYSGQKMVTFVRNGKLFVIMGATTRREILPDITLIIDRIIDSLEFSDMK